MRESKFFVKELQTVEFPLIQYVVFYKLKIENTWEISIVLDIELVRSSKHNKKESIARPPKEGYPATNYFV